MIVSALICAACALHPLAGIRFSPSPGQRRLATYSLGLRHIGAVLPALVMPIAMIEATLVRAVPAAWWALALVASSLALAAISRFGAPRGGSALAGLHRNLLPVACAWLLVAGAHGSHFVGTAASSVAPVHHSQDPARWLVALPAIFVLASLACLVGQLRTRPRAAHGRMPVVETVAGTLMLGVMAFA